MPLAPMTAIGNIPALPQPQELTLMTSPTCVAMQAVARRVPPSLHPKHFNRPFFPLSRSFHAASSLRALNLAFDYHENGGKATGAPIVFLHGLFGSKKNNRSMSKCVPLLSSFMTRGNTKTAG